MSGVGHAADHGARAAAARFDDEGPVGGREMIAIAMRHRWRIVAAFLLPPLIAVGLIAGLPKAYRAQSDIMVKTGREYMVQSDGGSANLTAPTSTKQESINSEVALLTSRAVAEAAIGAIGLDRLYPDIVADPPSSGSVLDAAVLRFGRDLVIEPVKLSNVLSTSFDAASPEQARSVLDTVIRLYIDTHAQVFAGQRAEGYREAIEKALAEIRTLEQRRASIKLANGIYDIDAQRKAVIAERIDAETRLEDAQSRQARLTAREAYLNKAREQVPAMTVTASSERSDAPSHASEALVDLRQQEAALDHRLGSANPDLQRLRSQIEAVTQAAKSVRKEHNATTTASPIRMQIDQDTITTGAELSTTASEIERLSAFVASCGAELARLERADLALRDTVLLIDIVTQNLKAMQGRYEQARVDEQTDVARQVSVVQVAAAIASEKPVWPKKPIFAAVGVLAGVLLAGLVAWLTILTSKTAVTGEAAERRVGLPVLAVVPLNGSNRAWAESEAWADEVDEPALAGR